MLYKKWFAYGGAGIFVLLGIIFGSLSYMDYREKEELKMTLRLLDKEQRDELIQQVNLSDELKYYIRRLEEEEAWEIQAEEKNLDFFKRAGSRKGISQRQQLAQTKAGKEESPSIDSPAVAEEQRRLAEKAKHLLSKQSYEVKSSSEDDLLTMKKKVGDVMPATVPLSQKLAFSWSSGEGFQFIQQQTESMVPVLIRGMEDGRLPLNEEMCNGIAFALLSEFCGEATMSMVAEANRGEDFINWLLLDEKRPLLQLMRHCELHRVPHGNMRKVLNTFYQLWKCTPSKHRSRYLNVMIAFAIVESPADKSTTISRPQLYRAFYQKNNEKALPLNLTRLSVRHLIHLADVKVTQEDFKKLNNAPIITKVKSAEEEMNRLLFSANDSLRKKEPKMSMIEVRECGLNSVDAVDFVVQAAKCSGLPAFYTMGHGVYSRLPWMTTWNKGNLHTIAAPRAHSGGRFVHPCNGELVHVDELMSLPEIRIGKDFQGIEDKLLVVDYLSKNNRYAHAISLIKKMLAQYPDALVIWRKWADVAKSDSDRRELCSQLKNRSHKSADLAFLRWDIHVKDIWPKTSYRVKKTKMLNELKHLTKVCKKNRMDVVIHAMDDVAHEMTQHQDINKYVKIQHAMLKENKENPYIFYTLAHLFLKYVDQSVNTESKDWEGVVADIFKWIETCKTDDGNYWLLLCHRMERCSLFVRLHELSGNETTAEKYREFLTTMEEAYANGGCRSYRYAK